MSAVGEIGIVFGRKIIADRSERPGFAGYLHLATTNDQVLLDLIAKGIAGLVVEIVQQIRIAALPRFFLVEETFEVGRQRRPVLIMSRSESNPAIVNVNRHGTIHDDVVLDNIVAATAQQKR